MSNWRSTTDAPSAAGYTVVARRMPTGASVVAVQQEITGTGEPELQAVEGLPPGPAVVEEPASAPMELGAKGSKPKKIVPTMHVGCRACCEGKDDSGDE